MWGVGDPILIQKVSGLPLSLVRKQKKNPTKPKPNKTLTGTHGGKEVLKMFQVLLKSPAGK